MDEKFNFYKFINTLNSHCGIEGHLFLKCFSLVLEHHYINWMFLCNVGYLYVSLNTTFLFTLFTNYIALYIALFTTSCDINVWDIENRNTIEK